ncbi:hypothetical protein GE09DRAFT_1223832 [Coniochaeta sp. 2T2.1]|nr:hypothetical protein GE09DRAFT_1223832 [Coniochaeta sp. 2T2.1]
MAYPYKETSYEPLVPGDERLSNIDSVESRDPDATLLRHFRKPSSRLGWLFQSGWKALAVSNTAMLVALLFIVVTHRDGHQCSEFECAKKTSYYSPLLEDDSDAIEYDVYKGTPNKELDEAWEYVQHMNNSGVGGNVIDRIDKSRIAVKYPEAQGGQYEVGIEVFHHVHCLNLIRQYTYREYYNRPENRPLGFTDSEEVIRAHIDHCIEMLRQALMCQGDVGIITYNWVKPWGIYPDFSTNHKCRKFDKIVEWADRHILPVEDPEPDEKTVYLPGPPQ